GKSRASASDTARGAAPDGSALASVPPQVIDRNGAASASRPTTMTTMNTTGRRITVCAIRYQAPRSSTAGTLRTERRMRRPVTRGPTPGRQAGTPGGRGPPAPPPGAPPAVPHRAQEHLGEQHQAGEREGDRDPGHRHGPACRGNGPRQRLLHRRLAVQFLPEP